VSGSVPCTAVVLAGGASRRFGSDKLEASIGGRPLLDRALEGLPYGSSIIVVGPERPLERTALFVREDPPGSGPGAAIVAGLREALANDAEVIVVLPGDAPHAGHAAGLLLQVLLSSPSLAAVVGTDAAGIEQPLQLALRRTAAVDLVAAAGPSGGHGARARALLSQLEPPAMRWPLSTVGRWDIDTPEALLAWSGRDSAAVRQILAAVDALDVLRRPVVVALDGPSGAGKSTLAAAVALQRPATVVDGDDFYSTQLARLDQLGRDSMADAEVADIVIDWRRLREQALEPLVRRSAARFARYDWVTDDGRLGSSVELPVGDLVIVDGVYSGRPELADLVDVSVYVDAPQELRRHRLGERGDDEPHWLRFWNRGESFYFDRVRPVSSFDLRVLPIGSV
jgi:molybdopterin-guanine dinucleotide biosynthesis protein A